MNKKLISGIFFLLLDAGLHAQSLQIKVYEDQEIARAKDEELMQFPSAFSFDVINAKNNIAKNIFVSWARQKDNRALPPDYHHLISGNSGISYGQIHTSPNIAFRNTLKKRDGSILVIPFKGNDFKDSVSSLSFSYHTSSDNGKTWAEHNNGRVEYGNIKIKGMRFHRGVIEDWDGTLYALAYGHFENDRFSSTWIVKSTDGGIKWKYLGTTAKGDMPFSESTIAQCADGSWLVVARNNHHLPMWYTRSRDKGLTWTPIALLPGLPVGSTEADDLNESVDPHLLMMPNGVLVLSYGRPNLHLAFSASGNGDDWGHITTTMVENPLRKTSAYSAIVHVASDQLAQIHDTGANWTYGKTKPEGAVYSVVQKFVDVKRDFADKIDLGRMFLNKQISVQTDLNFSRPASPETRVSGCFDGSTNYWSGAFKAGKKGSFKLSMDKPYNLSRIGLCMQTGFNQSAYIRYSVDGKKWKKLPVSYTEKTHYAIEYAKFETPITAKYLEISLKSSGKFTSLNEIELYGTSQK
ncbi:MAG: exo-alpha-sialidase [Daejeonella sp.]